MNYKVIGKYHHWPNYINTKKIEIDLSLKNIALKKQKYLKIEPQ